MKSIHTEIAIAAPAQAIWKVLTDFPGWGKWNPFLKVSGLPKKGERLAVTIAVPGQKPMTIKPTIVMLEEGRELRWLGRPFVLPGLFDGEHGFRIMPETQGCKFEQFESFTGLLSGAVFKRIEATTKTGFVAMNRMLKREAERAGRPG